MAREKVELLPRIEAALALVNALDGAKAPWPEQGRDPRGPGPLAHAVKALAVVNLVAVEKLFVREDVAVSVHDPLREAGGARRVVELRGIARGGVGGLVLG